jgi:hypothetical protein
MSIAYFVAALSGFVFAIHEKYVFSPPPVFKEGLGVVRFWHLTLFLSLRLIRIKGNHP